MLMLLFDLIMSAYQGALILHTLKKQIHQNLESKLYDALAVLVFALFFATIQYLHLPISDSLVFFIILIYAKWSSVESLPVCFFWSLVDFTMFIGTLTLVSGLFDVQIAMNGSMLTSDKTITIIYCFVSNAILTIVANIAAYFGKSSTTISHKETIVFTLMMLLSFAVNECIFISRISPHKEILLTISSACVFMLMVFTMFLYEQLTEQAKKQRLMELEAQTMHLVTEHQDELMVIYKDMLAIQHDLRHRVAAAEALLSSTNIDSRQRNEALQLLNSSDSSKLFFTGSIAVDAILKAKMSVIENAGITFEFDEYPLKPLPIPERSFCILLGNLLDNAIEGVMRLPASYPSRHIRLSFSKVWNMLFITCTNNADISKIKCRGDEFTSTKDRPGTHGFGIPSMKKIVAEANGTIEFEVGQREFSVHIFLGGPPPC